METGSVAANWGFANAFFLCSLNAPGPLDYVLLSYGERQHMGFFRSLFQLFILRRRSAPHRAITTISPVTRGIDKLNYGRFVFYVGLLGLHDRPDFQVLLPSIVSSPSVELNVRRRERVRKTSVDDLVVLVRKFCATTAIN